jgi:hypothetical protein
MNSTEKNTEIQKELWQMTKAEYEEKFGVPKKKSSVTGSFSPHYSAIEVALNRGMKVPKEVLNDYPALLEN